MDISKYFLLNDGAPIEKLYEKMLNSTDGESRKDLHHTYNIQDIDEYLLSESNLETDGNVFLREIAQETDVEEDNSYT